MQFKNYSITHSPNLHLNSECPVVVNHNLLKIKPTLILRYTEEIQNVKYATSNIYIIAFSTKIYIY